MMEVLKKKNFNPERLRELEALIQGNPLMMQAQLTRRRAKVAGSRWLLELFWRTWKEDYDFTLQPRDTFILPPDILGKKWRSEVELFGDPIEGTRMDVLKKLREFFETLPQTFPPPNA